MPIQGIDQILHVMIYIHVSSETRQPKVHSVTLYAERFTRHYMTKPMTSTTYQMGGVVFLMEIFHHAPIWYTVCRGCHAEIVANVDFKLCPRLKDCNRVRMKIESSSSQEVH